MNIGQHPRTFELKRTRHPRGQSISITPTGPAFASEIGPFVVAYVPDNALSFRPSVDDAYGSVCIRDLASYENRHISVEVDLACCGLLMGSSCGRS